MNKNKDYDKSYYVNNHINRINSVYGFIIKMYYDYTAWYAMASPAQLKKGDTVLDIGCGVGILVEQFKNRGYQVTGVDVNEEAIENSIAPSDCLLVESTANLSYPDDYFDLVVSREVLEHIPEEKIDACIKEWRRVSKGKMIHIIAVKERGKSATDDPAHINVQTEQWWMNKFRRHGFDVIKQPKKYFFSPFGSEGYFMCIEK